MILAFTAAGLYWTPLIGVLGGLCTVYQSFKHKCQNRARRRRQRPNDGLAAAVIHLPVLTHVPVLTRRRTLQVLAWELKSE